MTDTPDQPDTTEVRPLRKRGWPKGKPRGAQSESVRFAISCAQKRRWADPEKRARAVAGIKRSYQEGALSARRIEWTKDMDALLIALRNSMSAKHFRVAAPKKIGVCDRAVMDRCRALGLIAPMDSELGRIMRRSGQRRPRASRAQSAELRQAQAAADAYAESLLTGG